MSSLMPGVSPIATLLAQAKAAPDARLSLCDLSLQPRFGCKGPQAAAWLESQGLPIPDGPNRYADLPAGVGRVLRLGVSEFVVEGAADLVQRLAEAPRQPGVYPVLRQDACLGIQGEALNALLLQTCNVNFLDFARAPSPLVLTSMVGVSVVVQPVLQAARPYCRIWCDGTYGPYLWRTLLGIASELGGGVASANASFSLP